MEQTTCHNVSYMSYDWTHLGYGLRSQCRCQILAIARSSMVSHHTTSLIDFCRAYRHSFDADERKGCQKGCSEGERSSKMQKESTALEQKGPQNQKSWHDFCRIFEIFDDEKEFIDDDRAQTKTVCLYQQIVHVQSYIYKHKRDLELACAWSCGRSKILEFWCLNIKCADSSPTIRPQVDLFTMYLEVYDQGASWRRPRSLEA
jgi:hypothetical protein